MFINLIKYNLKYILKTTSIFASLFLISIILFNVTGYDTTLIFDEANNYAVIRETFSKPAIFQFLHTLFYNLIYISFVCFVLITILKTWRRFQNTFYSDEAYLTHTLPVSRNTLWNTQICSALLIVLSVLIVAIVGSLLLALSRDGMQILESLGLVGGCTHCVNNYYYVELRDFGFYLTFAFIIFTELAFILFCGFTGIIIGHRFNNHSSIWARVSGFGIYVVASIILLKIIYLLSLFIPSLRYIFGDPAGHQAGLYDDPNFIITTLFYIGIVYVCYNLVLYVTGRKLLKRGINLE